MSTSQLKIAMRDLYDISTTCPCPRRLDEQQVNAETWETIYAGAVMFFMFVALVSDRIGADSVMLTALTAFMAAKIVSIAEGIAGFANEGVLTVMVLFVVAEGISKTGALDWYMGKLLGHPTTAASAQLRLMAPVALVSAFMNNTPVVVVMIPIIQRWAKNISISAQQLLIPLSFASILGGTCTLIGTSTNLVVAGLLNKRYPNEPNMSIGLFDLGKYGVPVALAGIAYILLASPFLLPKAGVDQQQGHEDILLGARLTQWSPAAGRTVQRSGLRDTGGIYLVSVHRAATGNVHRAVSQDFVLNVGDILYFTGLVEGFGEFCEEHGLEVVTNEVEATITPTVASVDDDHQLPETENPITKVILEGTLPPVLEDMTEPVPVEVGVTKESLLQADRDERIRNIHRMTDLIRGVEPSLDTAVSPKRRPRIDNLQPNDPAKIVVTIDKDLVVVGINTRDRPGLLLDISKGLLRLDLQLHHTEAAVINERSVSIWRCEVIGTAIPDLEEIWSILSALLSEEEGIEAIKKRGLRVIRAQIVNGSRLEGKTVGEVDFRKLYKAAIVAVQKGGKNTSQVLSTIRLDAGDILVLQTGDDSHLLQAPPDDFYKSLAESQREESSFSRTSSVKSFVNLMTRKRSGDITNVGEMSSSLQQENNAHDENSDDQFFIPSSEESDQGFQLDEETGGDIEAMNEKKMETLEAVWKDLRLLNNQVGSEGTKEFLTAMEIAKNSKLAGKNVAQIGVNKLPNIFLVSIERPISHEAENEKPKVNVITVIPGGAESIGGESEHSSIRRERQKFTTIDPDEPLQEGDVLWFSGSASAVGDLRKIPGLVSYQRDEVEKINEKVFDRRLVQAVVARKGPLVGKTVKEARFRTRYGAAVIAVHREGRRVHEHPGNVKLHAGDVLLLEAGPSFFAKSAENDRSFALLSEVEDSAPPRLRLLIPALIIAAGMLVVFTAGLTSLVVAALVASILMVALGILSEQEARDAINWDVYVTIASAFGIGTALVNSGLAGKIANFLVHVGTALGIGDAGLIGAVYFATFLISNVVTNNAAAALVFPVALNAAEQTGTDRIIMSYALMLGASASFMSPFGYTTNLLIYGPGGYKYMDFVYFGGPMQIVLWVLSTAVLSVVKPWYVSWLGTAAVLVVVTMVRMTKRNVFRRPCNEKELPYENSSNSVAQQRQVDS